MHPSRLQGKENREFMEGLCAALEEDLGITNSGELLFYPDVRRRYRFAKGDFFGRFVRPTLVLRDVSDGNPIRILEIGDGVLKDSRGGNSFVSRLLQRIGIPREEPYTLGRTEYFNPAYFGKGTKTETFVSKRGYTFASRN